ncbi:Dihydroorotase [Planctomycetales bacterium 10988]|nr:Dihydroorotase [Planctomycetales bacterium 10988]
MADVLIRGGRIIDPGRGLDAVSDLLVLDGRIAELRPEITLPENFRKVIEIDATDKLVSPGFLDLHTHLREPGREEEETIASGTAAALAGGFTSIVCMPDTDPPIDSPAAVEFIRLQADRANHCNVHVLANVSKAGKGEELAEIGQLVEAGAVGFSDATQPIQNANLMRRALEYCLMFDRPIFNVPDVQELSGSGIMHEGMTSMLLGLPGIPAAAETVMVGRDIILSELTGGKIHLQNLSVAESVELLRRAKSRNALVTADICPQHFTLTDESLRSFESNLKVRPPLRSANDVTACIGGLQDGTIDCIVSGHSPLAIEKKMQELDQAPFGMVGLETVLPLVITELIRPGHLSWLDALAKLTCNPARVLGSDRGSLEPGAIADITIVDPEAAWQIDAGNFVSLSRNTPFHGKSVYGKVEKVFVQGELRFNSTERRTMDV